MVGGRTLKEKLFSQIGNCPKHKVPPHAETRISKISFIFLDHASALVCVLGDFKAEKRKKEPNQPVPNGPGPKSGLD